MRLARGPEEGRGSVYLGVEPWSPGGECFAEKNGKVAKQGHLGPIERAQNEAEKDHKPAVSAVERRAF
jgi:hypothetical protein